ncbi:hypothetical protein ABPG75_001278 [Micractinium tetrahymenae]
MECLMLLADGEAAVMGQQPRCPRTASLLSTAHTAAAAAEQRQLMRTGPALISAGPVLAQAGVSRTPILPSPFAGLAMEPLPEAMPPSLLPHAAHRRCSSSHTSCLPPPPSGGSSAMTAAVAAAAAARSQAVACWLECWSYLAQVQECASADAHSPTPCSTAASQPLAYAPGTACTSPPAPVAAPLHGAAVSRGSCIDSRQQQHAWRRQQAAVTIPLPPLSGRDERTAGSSAAATCTTELPGRCISPAGPAVDAGRLSPLPQQPQQPEPQLEQRPAKRQRLDGSVALSSSSMAPAPAAFPAFPACRPLPPNSAISACLAGWLPTLASPNF